MESSNPSSDANDSVEDYDGFGDYMAKKKIKLLEQQQGIEIKSDIFKGLRFHINGYTDPPITELQKLVIEHGGLYERFYRPHPDLYMLATHLPKAKIDKITANQVVVRPQWVLDSIASGAVLDLEGYRLYTDSKPLGLDTFVSVKNNDVNETSPQNIGRTSSTDPNFVQNFYKSSRLHHLSTWREALKQFAKELMEHKQSDIHSTESASQWIMHIDMDCFFVSVSARNRPDLEGKPVGVSHSAGVQGKAGSSSDLASVNYEARKFGLANGMYTRRALELCPNLTILPYDFEAYQTISQELYKVLAKYADVLQAVSCDEAFIAVSVPEDQVDALAESIREEIHEKCRCHASIGIGHNILLARLATKRAKPNGQYRVHYDAVSDFLAEQKLSDLPGVGPSIASKLSEEGWNLCSDLEEVHLAKIQAVLGPKLGKSVYDCARGVDNRQLDGDQQRKSVGSEISWGVRFDNLEQRDHFIQELATEVMARLSSIDPNLTARKLNVKLYKRQAEAGEPSKRLGRGFCDTLHKSVALPSKISPEIITDEVIKVIDSYDVPVSDIRGLGIFLVNLEEVTKGFDWSVLRKRSEPKTPSDPKLGFLEARGVAASVFNELDASMQEQILQEWGYYGAQEERTETPRKQSKLTHVQKKKSPEKAKPSSISVVDLLKGKKQPAKAIEKKEPTKEELEELGIDPECFNALPDFLKREILQEHRLVEEDPEVIVLDSPVKGPASKESFDFYREDLVEERAWEEMVSMLNKHCYEQVSQILSEIKNRPGAAELTLRVQSWFREHEKSILYIE